MVDLDRLCHVCGRPLDGPQTCRHPVCPSCAADRARGRKRLARRAHRNRKRAYAKGLPGQFSADDIRALWRSQQKRCAGCSRHLGTLYASPPGYHVDHVEALAASGSNSRANIQLLCPSCNLRKGAR